MLPKIIEHEGFSVVGISVRTNNAREATPDGVIAPLWHRFIAGDILSKIPYRASDDVFAVYTDYAEGDAGDYTVVIGARVSAAENMLPGMVAKTVPAGRYAVFTSDLGPPSKVVPETWRRVWATPEIRRTYRADFELYDVRGQNPEAAVVDIYVGIE